eukprot:3031094-Pleurochrysis_carterae.AAC.1
MSASKGGIAQVFGTLSKAATTAIAIVYGAAQALAPQGESARASISLARAAELVRALSVRLGPPAAATPWRTRGRP